MFLFHLETGQRIPSGHISTVTTSDPVARPLPSMELLELRWHLARVAPNRGAMEYGDKVLNAGDMSTMAWIPTTMEILM